MPKKTSGWKRQWKEFAAERPGRRFRDRYERQAASGGARSWGRRVLYLGGGVVLLAIGAFFAVAPGPAVIFFALGGVMIANGSLTAARLLDRIDVWIAPALRWVQQRWHRLSPATRRITTGCMIGGSVTAMAIGILMLR